MSDEQILFTKVVCIDNKNSRTHGDDCALTIGKTYYVMNLYTNDKAYTICNDEGNNHQYLRERFITFEEYRERKIDKLLSVE